MGKIVTKCPACSTGYRVDQENLGKRTRCRKCGAEFVIVSCEQAPSEAARSPATTPATTGQEQPRTAEADVPLVWNVGDVILDLYEVEHIHTGGGMGLVYRAHHRNWNMDLAVKSPRPEYLKTEAQKESFERECETWINLGLHPNIVSCYYVRRLGGIPRVFAEYVEGGSLEDWIQSGKLYEGGHEEALKRILDIAIQFAWGLHYAHEQGLAHQDVKPANLMMTPDGVAKVTDFGLARARAVTGEEQMAGGGQRGIVVSSGPMTPAYCSPEQANKQKLSCKTDIWSWAVSVLEMFAGGVTWPSGTVAPEALELLMQEGAQGESIPRMPDGLTKLLRHCFRQEPEERPNDMQEVAANLKGIYEQVTGFPYPREEPRAAELLADSLNNRALSLLEIGKKRECLELLQQAVEIGDPLAAKVNLAFLQMEDGAASPAMVEDMLEGVLAAGKSDIAAGYYAAAYELALGEPGKAASRLAAQQAEGLLDARGAMLLATAHLVAGDYEAARGTAARALQLWPLDRQLRRCLGAALHLAGRAEDAVAVFRQTVSEGPTDVPSIVSLAAALCSSGRLAEAAVSLRAAIRNHPESIWALLNAGEFFSGIGGTFHGSGDERDVELGRRCLQRVAEGAPLVLRAQDGLHALAGEVFNDVAAVEEPRVTDWERDVSPEESWLSELAVLECSQRLEGLSSLPTALAFSEDGRVLAVGHHDGSVVWFDSASGQRLENRPAVRRPGGRPIVALAMRSKLQAAVIAWQDGVVAVADMTSGALKREHAWSLAGPNALRIPWGAGYAVGACTDFVVRLVSLDTGAMTGELRLELEASQKAFGAPAAAIACDGHRVAFSSGLNNEVWLVDLDSGDLEGRAFCAEDAIISHLCVLNAQRCVLAGHQNGSLILWQLTEGGGDAHYVWREQDAHSGDLAFLAVLPGERWCVSAGEDGAVRLWDLVRRRCHRVLCKEREAIRSMAVSDDGRRLAVGCRQCVSIWQMRYTADSVHPVQWKAEPMLVRPWASRALVEEQSRYGLAVGAAEKALAEGKWAEAHADFRRALDVPGHERDRRVLGGIARAGVYGKRRGLREVWLASRFRCSRIFRDSGRARLLFSHPHPWVVRFAPDDSRMACGCRDASVQIWDVAGGRKRVSLEHNAAVLSMAWSRDGKSVMCGDGAGEIRVWDATEGRDVLGTLRCQTAWRAHTKSVTGLDVSLMGDRLVSAGGDGAVRVWDLSDRRCVAAFEHPGVEVVGCLSDGRRAVSAGAGGRVRVWDLQVGACLADFGAGSEHEVRALCEVPGLEAVLVAQECDFALLRLDGSGCLGRLRVHSSYVTALDVTPDSRWATSVSWDGQLKVWDLRTFTCSQALDSHRGRLFALGMSHDGRYAASGGDDSMLRLWEFDWEWEFELTNGLEREPLL